MSWDMGKPKGETELEQTFSSILEEVMIINLGHVRNKSSHADAEREGLKALADRPRHPVSQLPWLWDKVDLLLDLWQDPVPTS